MNYTPITESIDQLKAERERLDAAIEALEALAGMTSARDLPLTEPAPKEPGPFSGGRLREARRKAGLSQSELGELVGVRSNAVVSRWERDLTVPLPHMVDALARALRVQRRTAVSARLSFL